MTAKPIPLRVRRQVWERSGSICECGCGQQAVHIHHRKLRSQGGRHDLDNLLHLAHACHERIHGNPERAYEMGFLVHSWAEPGDVAVHATGVAL